MSVFSDIFDSIFGGDDSSSTATVADPNEKGIDWGSYILPAVTAGVGIYNQIGQQDQMAEQNALAAQQNAAQMEWDREKFYASLAAQQARGGGGGSGIDPRMLALQKQQVNIQRKNMFNDFYSQAAAAKQRAADSKSEAIRNLAQTYVAALK